MGFTIDDALIQTQDQYKLELLAGSDGCANAISWVHLIEDTTIIRQLWGKELAVTTGLGFQEEGELLKLVETLVKYHSVGLVVNTGQYIHEIPKDVIDYCNEQDFPLLTTPWEVHLADVIKDFCMRCLNSEKEDRQIARYFKNVIINPLVVEESRIELSTSFDVDGLFQVVLIDIEDSDQWDSITRRRMSLQIELYLEKIECPYSFFWHNGYFVLIVNNLDDDELNKIIKNMYIRAQKRMNKYGIHIGIGTSVNDFRNMILSYKRAIGAVKLARVFHQSILHFKDMGIYQILSTIEDKQILLDTYQNLLSPLIEYDQKHHGELEKTLYYYLEYNGSPQEMAKHLYTHRNTINYRLTKIKQLLNNALSSYEDLFPYMMAFYIKSMFENE